MDYTSFTTYDQIRALLGVTAKELRDATIALPHWALGTELALNDIDDGGGAVLAMQATIAAVPEASRTANQKQFMNVLNMYVTYSASYQLSVSADSWSPTSITDGKAAVDRLATRFQDLRPALEGGLLRLKERLKDALQALSPSAAIVASVARVMIAGVGLATDPVTGT